MYEFPPPIWTNQDWTVGNILSILVVGIILPMIAARKSRPHVGVVVAWFLFVAVLWYLEFELWSGFGKTFAPYQYMIALPLSATLIACVAIYRIWNQSEGVAAFWNGMVVLCLCGFAAVFVVAPLRSHTPYSPRGQCRNNLKQIGFALHNYHDQWQRFPPASLGPVEVSWRINLLPFIEQEKLAQKYDRSQRWDGPANAPLQTIRVSEYACPTRPNSFNSSGQFLTSYVAPTLPGAIFAPKEGSAIADIKDGTSNTLLTMEACGTSIVWSSPVDTEPPAIEASVNQPGSSKGLSNSMTSSWHFGGSQTLLADGSVRFIATDTDTKILQALVTRQGGEKINEW